MYFPKRDKIWLSENSVRFKDPEGLLERLENAKNAGKHQKIPKSVGKFFAGNN